MSNSEHLPEELTRERVISLLPKFLLYLVIGWVIAEFASSFVYIYYFGEDLSVITKVITDPENHRSYGKPLLLLQGVYALCMFLVMPLYFASKTQFPIHYDMGNNKALTYNSFVNVALMMFFALPLSSFLGELNAGLPFNSDWITKTEAQYKALTIVLTYFPTLQDFLVGIVIIALLAATGEEFLFRGLIQPMLQKMTNNNHVGIIITAFIFAAIHMQFLSFLPRFALGIVLGYLYFYSKNLWVPIVAHFVNNATALFVVYKYGVEEDNLPVGELENYPIVGALIGAAVVVVTLIFQKRAWAKNWSNPHGN